MDLFLIHFSPLLLCALSSGTLYGPNFSNYREMYFLRSFNHNYVCVSLLYYAFAIVFSLLLTIGIVLGENCIPGISFLCYSVHLCKF